MPSGAQCQNNKINPRQLSQTNPDKQTSQTNPDKQTRVNNPQT